MSKSQNVVYNWEKSDGQISHEHVTVTVPLADVDATIYGTGDKDGCSLSTETANIFIDALEKSGLKIRDRAGEGAPFVDIQSWDGAQPWPVFVGCDAGQGQKMGNCYAKFYPSVA